MCPPDSQFYVVSAQVQGYCYVAGAILNVKCFSRGLFGDQCCGMIVREKGFSKMLRRAKCFLDSESLFVSWRNANQEEKMTLKSVCFKCLMPFWFWEENLDGEMYGLAPLCLVLFLTPASVVSCTHCLPMMTLMATKLKKEILHKRWASLPKLWAQSQG